MRDESLGGGGKGEEWGKLSGSRTLFNVLGYLSGARGGRNEDGNTHLNSNTSRSRGTSDTDDLALQAEEVLKGIGFGYFDRHDCCFVRVMKSGDVKNRCFVDGSFKVGEEVENKK